jgi:predicted RNA-binding Zn-ribbon protein involved in translation (DUF1610 family)
MSYPSNEEQGLVGKYEGVDLKKEAEYFKNRYDGNKENIENNLEGKFFLEEGDFTRGIEWKFEPGKDKEGKIREFPRCISIPTGVALGKNTISSNQKCPECGERMVYKMSPNRDNVIDYTSSYAIYYRCYGGHGLKMSLDEAIGKYGTEL